MKNVFTRSTRAAFLLASALSMSIPLSLLGFQAPSQALCVRDNMGGRWENVDANTQGITQVNYIPRCGDQRICDLDGNCSEPARTSIEVFGACSPTDCEWGEADVNFRRDEWRYSIYDQGFAQKVVWMKLESNGQLTVAVQVDYRDSRADRTSWYRFNKVGS